MAGDFFGRLMDSQKLLAVLNPANSSTFNLFFLGRGINPEQAGVFARSILSWIAIFTQITHLWSQMKILVSISEYNQQFLSYVVQFCDETA